MSVVSVGNYPPYVIGYSTSGGSGNRPRLKRVMSPPETPASHPQTDILPYKISGVKA